MRGKKKSVIPGRVPSLFANINNNNQENDQIERGINADSNNQSTQNLPSGVNNNGYFNHVNDQPMTQNASNVAANNNYHVDYSATDFGDDNIQTTSNSIWPSEQIGSAYNIV